VDDTDVSALAEAVAQFPDELGIPLHSENPSVGFSQMGGDGALSGAELDDEIGLVQRAGLDELGGDPGHRKEMHAAGMPGTGCRGHGASTS
jgi:hypothetical protein